MYLLGSHHITDTELHPEDRVVGTPKDILLSSITVQGAFINRNLAPVLFPVYTSKCMDLCKVDSIKVFNSFLKVQEALNFLIAQILNLGLCTYVVMGVKNTFR